MLLGAVNKHSLRPYLDYVAFLYQKLDPIPEQERFEVPLFFSLCNIHLLLKFCYCCLLVPSFFYLCWLQLGYRDYLQSPLQASLDSLFKVIFWLVHFLFLLLIRSKIIIVYMCSLWWIILRLRLMKHLRKILLSIARSVCCLFYPPFIKIFI